MAPGKTHPGRSLADQLADLEDPTPKVVLGKQYAGARVSRDALEADSDDDPFAALSDESDQSVSDEIESSSEESSTGRSGLGDGTEERSEHNSKTGQIGGKSTLPKKKASKNKETTVTSQSPSRYKIVSSQNSSTSRGKEDLTTSADESDSESALLASISDDELDTVGDGSIIGDQLGEVVEDVEMDDFDVDSENALEEVRDEDVSSEEENQQGAQAEGRDAESMDDDEDEQLNQKNSKRVHFEKSRSKETKDDREELRKLMASDQKTIAATISQAAKADAVKGRAVKEQRTVFDALLNTRIKLQKGLTVMNEAVVMIGEEDDGMEENGEAIKSAESAALALWSTLEELRLALTDSHAKDETKKRKRPSSISSATSSPSLWARMEELESASRAHRRAVLDKWSAKVRGASTSLPNARGKLLGSASGQQTITAVLDAHIATEIGERASKRSRSSEGHHEPVYDDTIFYQSLLRDLVEQRMSSSDAMTNGLDTLHQLPSRLPIHPVTGMRNDKVKRDIDTRASKGRKMRFNVHEKLQNFMAPEDRGAWSTRARDEFFASLLGKTASGLLGEADESASGEDSDDDREESGLRLFRT
ncbi:rRNA-processing protein bfr2 [Penicillium lagena]|uniref:rRNA-processing protein bfr2 n=1 Tax=Penicillium lagena TaxID=94218 RepID=UPI0025418FB5|nr:rRNA-processing protein bfr2 [Penicillium lagena]KAJ5604394.1 rRNA-processing protein bfr2 [Penicillium lagena]